MKEFSKIKTNKLVFGWLLLAISALGVAGLYSIFLVALRSPGISEIFPKKIFVESLIVHVNLSITVWFLAFLGLINAIASKQTMLLTRFGAWALACSIFGALLIAFSPIFGGQGHKNNYVPMLENFPFIFGIAMVLTGSIISSIGALISFFRSPPEHGRIAQHGMRLVSFGSSLIFIIAFICFIAAGWQLKKWLEFYDFASYAEAVFWGFGHVVQFVYLQIYMFALICLYQKITGKDLLSLGIIHWVLGINLIIILPCPLFYYVHQIDSGEYTIFFTDHMKHFGGIAILLLIIITMIDYIKTRPKIQIEPVSLASLICSLLMFGFGGLIGFNIEMENVVIPAHYHGSIVAITTALMGLCYLLLGDKSSKTRMWQIISYNIGQLMHIGGLAMAGGYGALRKTPGVELGIEAKLYLGIMGTGGIIAIISGMYFVIHCLGIMLKKEKQHDK